MHIWQRRGIFSLFWASRPIGQEGGWSVPCHYFWCLDEEGDCHFFSEPGRKEWDILKRVKFIYSECRWDKVIPKAKSQHAGMRARKMKGREGQDKGKRREKNPHNFVWAARPSHTWKFTHISTCWRWNWSQRFGTKAGLYKTKDLSIPCLSFAY